MMLVSGTTSSQNKSAIQDNGGKFGNLNCRVFGSNPVCGVIGTCKAVTLRDAGASPVRRIFSFLLKKTHSRLIY